MESQKRAVASCALTLFERYNRGVVQPRSGATAELCNRVAQPTVGSRVVQPTVWRVSGGSPRAKARQVLTAGTAPLTSPAPLGLP